ncbi:MAG: contractile injection system tape measure protein [Longimicrobiaceae bacterium]
MSGATGAGNRVRRERLVVEAATAEAAMALQPRLGDLNRLALVPAIDAVLAELSPPGRQVRIERLELDLGEVSAAALEDELPRRLEAELRRALSDALRGGEAAPAPGVAWRGEREARAELLERHLARGTLPFWAPPSARSLEGVVTEMAVADPDGLAAVVRRVGRRRVVLERLAAQLRDPALAALVRVLEPAHASVVLAYVFDLRRVHRRAPLLPLGERRFGRLLWVVVQAYLVRDPGSQFNRKSFVRSLLRGMGRAQGIEYAALLDTLRTGLERTRRRGAARSSLPAVVAELLRDLERGPARPRRPAARPGSASPLAEGTEGGGARARRRHPAREREDERVLAAYDRAGALGYLLRHGVLPWDAALRGMDEADLAAALPDLPRPLLLAVLGGDDLGERERALAALARRLSEDALARLLLRLVPGMERGDGAFGQAVAGFAAAAPDRRVFLARVVGAALDGGVIDLEALAAAPGDAETSEASYQGREEIRPTQRRGGTEGAALPDAASPREALSSGPDPRSDGADSLAAWPSHLLASVLTRALGAGPRAAADDPPPGELLAALVAAHPADARHYLHALGEHGRLADALARCAPEPLHGTLVELLAPAAVKAVGALHAALAALPAPERRFSADELRQVLLAETMRLGDGEAPAEAFFSRVLARLLGPRLPGAAGERLLQAAEGWVYPAGVPAAEVEAFRGAVAAASGREPEPRPAAGAPRERTSGAGARRELREAVFAWLLGRGPAAGGGSTGDAPPPPASAAALSGGMLQHALQRMVEEEPDEVFPFLRRHSADRRVRERWVRVLPEPVLARLGRLLGPRRHAPLLRAAEMLAAAWAEAAPPGHPALAGRAAFWDFLLEFLARNAGADRLAERLVEAFFADRAARCRGLSPAPELAAVGARLLEAAGRLAHTRGDARLRSILHRHRARLAAAWDPAAAANPSPAAPAPEEGARPGAASARPSADPEEGRAAERGGRPRAGERPRRRPAPPTRGGRGEAEEEGEPIYVANAGLVLAGAFLPHLFAGLELLGEDQEGRPRLRDADAVSRAVHLLQYLVDGSTDTPEPLLVLNKLLCGVAVETPVERAIDPEARERELCDRLLAALLASWPPLANTSVEGLRQTFLQREGRLERAPGGWRLTVQRKTVDVLLDEAAWPRSVVDHRWMPEPLYVSW